MAITIALDLGGTSIKLALVNNGKLLGMEKILVDENTTLEPFLPVIEDKVSALARQTKVENNFEGIGMAFPSIVDSDHGKILSKYVKYADVNQLNLSDWARKNWGIPLVMENDARAALVGEWQHGAGIGKRDIVQVTIGTGVGSAVLIDGKILKGKHFQAGNLGGHMTIKYDGNLCNCGNIGCLESEASTWSLPDKVRSHPNYKMSLLKSESHIDFQSLFRLASQRDILAERIRDECINAWSFGLINLVHSFDPEMIIVSGGIMKSKEFILSTFQEMVDRHTWLPAGTVQIVAAKNEEHAALLGIDYIIQNINL